MSVDFEHQRASSDMARYYYERSNSSSGSSLSVAPFGFDSKTKYDANESLITIRSDNFAKQQPIVDDDIWKRPQPDFRPKIFAPKPPKRNTTESMKPWKYGTIAGQREVYKRDRKSRVPHILMPKKEEEERFDTLFRLDRPFTAKKKFVSEGMNKPGQYSNPPVHDFRGIPPIKKMGLPEFQTENDHDPFDIYFNTQRLNVIIGNPKDRATDRDIKGIQMCPPLPNQADWERQLILDKERWPTKPGEFNRHRLRFRPARSAFMERVSRTIEMSWAKEKLDQEIEKAQMQMSES